LEGEFAWRVLCLQEFSAAEGIADKYKDDGTTDGHAVFITPPSPGSRAAAIVVHKSIVHTVIPNSFRNGGRVGSLLLQWQGYNIRIVNCHLPHSGHNNADYYKHLEELDFFLERKRDRDLFISDGLLSDDLNKKYVFTVLGIDAQAELGVLEDFDNTGIVGPFGYGRRRARGQSFIDLCVSYKLRILNSYSNESSGNWTCTHWGKAEPSQLDYIATDLPLRSGVRGRLTDSAATATDHLIVSCTFFGVYWRHRRWNRVDNPKPLRWTPTRDIEEYNGEIREYLGLPKLERNTVNKAFNIFTDGSYHPPGRRRKIGFAGWGFVVYNQGKYVCETQECFNAFGPVVILNCAHGFLGATRKTNNTAELHAFIEAAIWSFGFEPTNFVFHIDSLYVIRLLKGDFMAKENVSISILAQHWWDTIRQKHNCSLVWVKGHSGNVGNDRADGLADQGCWDINLNKAYVRPPISADWKQDVFVQKLSAANHISQTILGQTSQRRRKTVGELHNTQHLDDFYRNIDDLPIPFISDITKTITEAAKKHGKSRPNFFGDSLEKDHELVIKQKDICRRRKWTTENLERKTLSLELNKIRKEIKALKIEKKAEKAVADMRSPHKFPKPTTVYALYDHEDEKIVYEEPEDILEHAETFYKKLFTGTSSLPAWIWNRWQLKDLYTLPFFDGRNLSSLISALKAGKTCAEDQLVAEMLQNLDLDILHLIAEAFKLRILNHGSEIKEEAWNEVVLNLIPKKKRPRNIKQFRPIAILAVLQKLYIKVLDSLSEGKLKHTKAIQFAFKPGHQCHEPVFILRRLVEVAIEWNVPIFVLDGDIVKAYDNTEHTKVLEALQRKGIPDILSAAILREISRARCKVKLGNLSSKVSFCKSRALWQGDPQAPYLFNQVLDEAAYKMTTHIQRMKWGWPITINGKTEYIGILIFADNYWLIGTSPAELEAMNTYWQNLLKSIGYHTPVCEMRYSSTAQDDQYLRAVLFNKETVKRESRQVGFKVLGTQLTFNNRNDAELVRRIKAAWGAFFKHADILCCKAVPMFKRLRYFKSVVHPALFWCSGSWNLRADQFIKVRGVQRSMFRKMSKFTKGEGEGIEDFMQRTEGAITGMMHRFSVAPWDVVIRRNIFIWAGWVARLAEFDSERLTLKVLNHRNWKWVQNVAACNKGRQLHGRILSVWRWEAILYKYAKENLQGEDWQVKAQTKPEWDAIVWGIR
jgi:ribonuclease HI